MISKLCRLTAIVVALAAIFSTDKQAQKKGDPIFVAPLGVQAYSFRNYFPKDFVGTLDRVKAFGFTEMEGGGGRIPADEYRRLCEERGIKVVSTGAGFDQLEKDPQAIAETAKQLGSKFVMCAWVPHERGKFSMADAQKAVAVFNKAGKVLKENGLTLCYHAHGYEFQPWKGKKTLLDYIIQNTDPNYVSYQMDIFWIQFGGGDPVKLLKKYGDRWQLMHLKDMRKGIAKDLTGGTDVNNDVPLGTGQIDIAGVLKMGRKIGIKHYFIEDESDTVMDQVPQSIAYLKSLKY